MGFGGQSEGFRGDPIWRARACALAGWLVIFFCGLAGAQTIQDVTLTTGNVTVDFGASTINATVSSPSPNPPSVYVGSYSGQSQVYDLAVSIAGGNYSLDGSVDPFPGLVDISNQSGGISVTNAGTLELSNALSPASSANGSAIGSAALRVIAQPLSFGSTGGTAQSVSVTNSGNITLSGSAASFGIGTFLEPAGFRMADLSGILALSYGAQSFGSQSGSGGNVTVVHQNATIGIGPAADISAGISASSANGPGNDFGTRPQTAVSVTLDNGQIANSGQLAMGVMATATGAQFPSGSSTALGGNVSVGLLAGSSISANGSGVQTGIGVFAASEVYVPKELPKGSHVQAGTVDVGLEGSSITAGAGGAQLSIGVLAVSAGTDLLVSPFTSQAVNGFGTGRAGQVNISLDEGSSISTAGTLSAGIAGLSVGGAAIVTTNDGSQESYLGNSEGDTDGYGSAVWISNNGSVSTLGTSAYGIVGFSGGGGGLINNDLGAIGGNSSGGLVVGSNSKNGTATSGGNVTILHGGTVTTGDGNGTGATSIGIVAQSVGGGGGNAGGNHPALFVGDKGGMGGNGSSVLVEVLENATVTTLDADSHGILAQSIGGGGGNGANAVGIFVSLGGRGGSGGEGGEVDVRVSGDVQTAGDSSAGVVAQSIGGGGGNGGSAKTVLFSPVEAGIGGKGGSGGNGGDVTSYLYGGGSIATNGNNSPGMMLQSLGGGGGTGGGALSYDSASFIVSLTFEMGGGGGTAGVGGNLTATNFGQITTGQSPAIGETGPRMEGADSIGILAQSIGGGGGSGGTAVGKGVAFGGDPEIPLELAATVTIGGNASSGAHAGEVDATNYNSIKTWGDGSHGMVAQSVGGGGGIGGDSTASSALIGSSDNFKISATVAVGGQGGGGGSGGQVGVSNISSEPGAPEPSIETYGQSAHAILAQSIGGGGGIAGIGNTAIHTPNFGNGTTGNGTDSGGNGTSSGGNGTASGNATLTSFTLSSAIGAQGGDGGHAGSTTVSNGGNLSTWGSDSSGILAQAIGGGGGLGSGGVSGGSNNNIVVDLTVGRSGGSGGSANTSVNGDGFSVEVTNTGSIITRGGDSMGIAAQSIGGGGGKGGSSDAEATTGIVGSIATALNPSKSYSATIAVGGSGGNAGAGGNVSVTNSGGIETSGSRAFGIVAQSVSGGGGMGGSASSGANATLFSPYDTSYSFSASVAVGGAGGDPNEGGAVTVANSGNITTAGYGAHGIVAQSVAGGGGIGADGTPDAHTTLGLGIGVNQEASGDSTASGGAVTVSHTGTISTLEDDAAGIVAQSIGGGGGMASGGSKAGASLGVGILPLRADINLGINTSGSVTLNGGNVTIDSSSSITSAGNWSHGMVAQSVGAGGGKTSTIFGTNLGMALPQLEVVLGAKKGSGAGGAVNIGLAAASVVTGGNGSGFGAVGILGQSVGGGGGLATDISRVSTGNLTLGGRTHDASGNGGAVSLSGSAGIQTAGDSAFGVLLQSVGAGGGFAGTTGNYSGDGSYALPALTLGGGNATGHGGKVSLNATLSVATSGENAFGVVAQSVGGGGGVALARGVSTVSLGMNGTNGNNGGELAIALGALSDIQTGGNGSHALVIQSIGGGGGIAGANFSGGLSANASAQTLNPGQAHGYGGNVTADLDGEISSSGDGAAGVIAQVVAGGGGLAGNYAGSTGSEHSSTDASQNGLLSISVGGNITASGNNATGLFAQNVTALGSGNTINITVSGRIGGGAGSGGVGIQVDQGSSSNKLQVESGGFVSSLAARAILYTGNQTLAVANSGTVAGSVILKDNGAEGTFHNTGTLKAEGAMIGSFTDNATMYVGVDDSAGATATFGGNYRQGEEDTMLFMGIFGADDYDQIAFEDGANGVFGGDITVSFASLYSPELHQQFTLVGAAAGNWFSDNYVGKIRVTGLAHGYDWDAYTYSDSISGGESLILEIIAIPEPSVFALLILAGSGFLASRIRKRRAPVLPGR